MHLESSPDSMAPQQRLALGDLSLVIDDSSPSDRPEGELLEVSDEFPSCEEPLKERQNRS